MKFYTLQGCPNLAHHKLSRSPKDIPSPKTIQLGSASRLQDIWTMVKQVQQHRPNVPTNPDRSCTYLILKAHRIVQAFDRRAQSCPWWPPATDRLDQYSEDHWPGGLNKDDPRARENPREKGLGRQMVKPRLGLAGRVLFKAKSGNITPV